MSTLVLVPSSQRVAGASRRLCDAEGGVLFGQRVTTPAQLAAAVLASSGDQRAVLTPLAERLLAFEAARDAGVVPASGRVEGGASRAVASAIDELRRSEVPASALDEAARRSPGRVAERLDPCARMLRGYEQRLAELRVLDRAGSLAAAAAIVQRGRWTGAKDLDLLVVQGFAAAPAAEWRLVSALAASARRTHARLPHYPERGDVDGAEPLLRRFEALHDLSHADIRVQLEDTSGRAPALATALLSVAGGIAPPLPGDAASECVTAIAGSGELGEAWAAAEQAARWIDAGVAPDEVTVFAPSPADAAPRLAAAFAEHGLPFATGVGETLAGVPVVRALLALLRAAAGGLDRATLDDLLGSTYLATAVPPPRVRELLDRAGAIDGRGRAGDLLRRRAAGLRPSARERDAHLRAAEAIADLERLAGGLRGAARASEHAARLRAVLDAGARRRAARAEPAIARRDVAALKRLEDCCEGVVTALAMTGRGGVPLSEAEWSSVLRLALDGATLPAADPASGAVELWAVGDAAGASCAAAVITGCARGAFPSAPSRPGLLRDGERAAVNAALGRAALPAAGRDRAEALHQAFCALAAPRDHLAMTWASGGSARASGPAPLVVEVLAAVGRRAPPAPAQTPTLNAAPSPRAALAAAARLAGRGLAAVASEAVASVAPLGERLGDVLDRAAVEAERRRAAASREAAPHAGAVAPGALLEAALPREWSPTQLETDARCPFRFFLETACGLSAADDPVLDVSSRDEGRLLHRILERFLATRIARAVRPLEDSDAARGELRACAAAVFAQLETSGKLGDPVLWPPRREAILARLERVLAAEAAVASADGVQPAAVEHAFGGDAAPMVLSDGRREVRLCGRIDRIDASSEVLRVVDWKNGRSSSGAWRDKVDPEAFGVTSFQLPAYLIAARAVLPGRSRLEATYAFLRSASRGAAFATDGEDALLAIDPAARARSRDGGERPFADAVLDVVARMRQGRFPVSPRDCSGCGLGAVCRAEGTEEDGA